MCGVQRSVKLRLIRAKQRECGNSINRRWIGKRKFADILFILRKTGDSYLDTKKPQTSKTVKTNFLGPADRHEPRSTIALRLAMIIG
jgi:hypothetical protein